MSKRVKEFLDKLENDFPPMDQGYIIFQGGLFTKSVWYRFNLDLECWEWTYDLNIWYSVESTINDTSISPDNGIIINYLKLKSLNKNIKMTIGDAVHELFTNYNTIEKIAIQPKYVFDKKIQNITEKLNFHLKELDRKNETVSNYQNLVWSDSKEKNTEKPFLTNYNYKIILAKMDVIEHRLKISILNNNLKNRLQELIEQSNKGDDIAMPAHQSKIITEIGTTPSYNIIENDKLGFKNEIQNLKKTINDYQIKYNQKCVSLENYKSQNEDLMDKMNNQENIKKIKSLEMTVAKSEALKTELKFQINELEIQLSNSDSEMYTLCKETEKIKACNQILLNENIQLKKHLDSVLALCPEISFDEHEKSYLRREDTYDMVDDSL
jgi:hypothetical protein